MLTLFLQMRLNTRAERGRVGAKFKSTFEVKQSLQIFQEKQFCQIYQHERLSLGNNTQSVLALALNQFIVL